MNRWRDHFVQIGATARGLNSKTSKADVMVWEGHFDGHLLCIVSTVRLTAGNLAHFLVNSGKRIGSNDWSLHGGHYTDLRVLSRTTLTTPQLLRIAQLARTDDTRPVAVRQGKMHLDEAVWVTN